MELKRNIFTVDSHTAGEPTRVVVGGFPPILGEDMAQKRKYLSENLDDLRKFLMREPRGHDNMFGSIITEPTNKEASIGVIFMDNGGYLNMCGHGTIGTSKVALEMGLIKKQSPITSFKIDTPAGLVDVNAKINGEKVEEISFLNVASFVYATDLEVDLDEFLSFNVDICFGGNFFAMVPANVFGLAINKENIYKFRDLGIKIRDYINKHFEVVHPLLPNINTVDLIEFYEPLKDSKKGYKNIVVFGEDQFDRSPCGTGTSAKLALMHHKKEIEIDESITSMSVLGSELRGKVTREVEVGNFKGIIPEITGRAFITAYNNLILEDEDIFEHGIEF